MTAAERCARFACRLSRDEIPPAVIEAAKLHFLDAVGVGLAASTVPLAQGWRSAAIRLGPGNATGLGGGGGMSAIGAALLNGALIHSLEYDDTHVGSVVHGSAVAASAALAVAEETGAGGADLLCGYIAAWDVMIRFGLAAPGAYQANGFQISAIGGAIGAALAASRIDGLTETETINALGIAGSQASGLLAFLSDGSTVKALHPGWAAHTGLTAALLAQSGMTGPAAILEGKFGFLASFARDDAAPERLAEQLADLGTVWHLPDAAFKFHPCCHYIHPFLEALSQCVDSADGIDVIRCHVPRPMAPLICEPWTRRQTPVSGYDGKWGLAYCLAAKLVTGRVDVETFAGDPDPAVIAVARRIEWHDMTDHDFPRRFQARVFVRLTTGEAREAQVDDVFGGPARPASRDQVLGKFRANAARVLTPGAAEALEAVLVSLDDLDTLAPLSRALTATA